MDTERLEEEFKVWYTNEVRNKSIEYALFKEWAMNKIQALEAEIKQLKKTLTATTETEEEKQRKEFYAEWGRRH